MIGTEILIIILLWCGDPAAVTTQAPLERINECRKEKIACVRTLPKGYDNDDIVDKCLFGKPNGK